MTLITFIAVDKTTMLDVEGYFDFDNQVVIGSFEQNNDGNKIYIVKPFN